MDAYIYSRICTPALAASCSGCSKHSAALGSSSQTPVWREYHKLPGEPRTPSGAYARKGEHHMCPGLLQAGPCFLSHRPGSWDKFTFSIPSCPAVCSALLRHLLPTFWAELALGLRLFTSFLVIVENKGKETNIWLAELPSAHSFLVFQPFKPFVFCLKFHLINARRATGH